MCRVTQITPNSDLCAVILAGGESRRMGFNKALLEINGRPVIQTLAELARKITDEVLISANDAGGYAFLGLTIVPDVHRGQGPMAGLHAAFARTSRSLVLLMACDLPNLRGDLLRSLIHGGRSSTTTSRNSCRSTSSLSRGPRFASCSS